MSQSYTTDVLDFIKQREVASQRYKRLQPALHFLRSASVIPAIVVNFAAWYAWKATGITLPHDPITSSVLFVLLCYLAAGFEVRFFIAAVQSVEQRLIANVHRFDEVALTVPQHTVAAFASAADAANWTRMPRRVTSGTRFAIETAADAANWLAWYDNRPTIGVDTPDLAEKRRAAFDTYTTAMGTVIEHLNRAINTPLSATPSPTEPVDVTSAHDDWFAREPAAQ